MKKSVLLLAILASVLALGWIAVAADDTKTGAWPGFLPFDGPETRALLAKINGLKYYEKPDLPVKKDDNYASTPMDVEPFGGVKPYKEHFLTQMEYIGPGRSIPEPADVQTVKIGFIGPIMSTVSAATGGKSHEEALGIQMLAGSRLAIEEANARGG